MNESGDERAQGGGDGLSGSVAVGALLAVFAIALALPIPDKTVALKILLMTARRTPNLIVVSGNSILSHTSRCDAERVGLTSLIGEALDGRVHDVGHPGQEFPESMNFLALALRQANVSSAVFMMNLNQMRERGWPSLQTQLFMMARASPDFAANGLAARFAAGFALTGGTPSDAFSYAGTAYPDYDGRKDYFAREKAAMGCPETLGVQRRFIEANFWHQYAAPGDVPSHYDDLRVLQRLARELGKRLLVVLTPVDYRDAAALNPAVDAEIERHMDEVARRIAALGVETLDLQRSPQAADFADRWCACGHLSEQGRRWVAERVSARLAATP